VASIKRNRDGGPVAGLRRFPGGRFEATNVQLASLISFAYQLQLFELSGGPPWLMDDGGTRLGKGIRRSTVDCLAIQRAADEAAKGGPPAPNPNTPDRLVCGLRVGIGGIQFGGRPLAMLTNVLTAITQRRVVDRTGFTGDWEFDISFNALAAQPGIELPSPDPDADTLFTVLQEQLGLRLEAARLPMTVMVVDRVELPVED
jgi:hypothetical protein